jgi:hypothetical protein
LSLILKINGATRTSYVCAPDGAPSVNITEQLLKRYTCTFDYQTTVAGTSPTVGQTVQIYDGLTLIFAGRIESVDRNIVSGIAAASTAAKRHTVRCTDWNAILDNRLAGFRKFNEQKLNDILLTLVSECLGGDGITTGAVPANTGPVIREFSCDYQTVAEAFDAACGLAGGYAWRVGYDKALQVYQPAIESVFATVGNGIESRIVEGSVSLSEDLTQYANRVVGALGHFLTEQMTDTITSSTPVQGLNGSRREFFTTYALAAVPIIRVDGVDQSVDTQGGTVTPQWYWAKGSNVIEQDSGQAALTAGKTLTITYVGVDARELVYQNATEIAARAAIEGGSGIHEKLVRTDDEMGAADAEAYLTAELDRSDSASYILRFDWMGSPWPEPGRRITWNRSGYPSGDYIIRNVTTFWVGPETNAHFARRRVEAVNGPLLMDGIDSLKKIAGQTAAPSIGGNLATTTEPSVVSAPGPITNIVADAVDYSDPAYAHITGSATLPASLNGFCGCNCFVTEGSNEPNPCGDQAHPVGAAGPFKFDFRIGRPASNVTWRFWFCSKNQTVEAPLNMVAGGSQTPYVDVAVTARPASVETAPTQPAAGEWSVALGAAGQDSQTLQQKQAVDLTITSRPVDVDYWTVWQYQGTGRPSDPSAWQDIAAIGKSAAGSTTVESWIAMGAAALTYQFCVTGCSNTYTAFPDGSTPIHSVTVPASSLPVAPTSASVVIDYQVRSGVKYGRHTMTAGVVADPKRTEIRWERTPYASNWTNPGTAQLLFSLKANDTPWSSSYDWPWPQVDEWWTYQVWASGPTGKTACSQIVQVHLTPSGGFDASYINTATVGKGLTVRSSQLQNLSSSAVLLNGDFEQQLDGWTIVGTVTADSTTKHSGVYSATAPGNGAYNYPYQILPCIPGQLYRLKAYIKNSTNKPVFAGIAFRDTNYGAVGTDTYVPVAPGSDWTLVSVAAKAPDDQPTKPAWMLLIPLFVDTSATSGSAWCDQAAQDRGVDSEIIVDLSVTQAKLADAAVTTAKLAGLSVDNSKLAALAVDAAKLANSAVTATKIANAAVGSAAIASAAIGTAHIGNGVIVSAHIGNAQIVDAHIANATIQSAKIASIDGHTLSLTVGNYTSRFDIVNDAVLSDYVGFQTKNNVSGQRLAVTSGGIAIVTSANLVTAQIGSIGGSTYPIMRLQSSSTDVTQQAYVGVTIAGYQLKSFVRAAIYQDPNGNAVVQSRRTGWTAPTGTRERTAFNADNTNVVIVAQRLAALLDDLMAHGLIGS